MRVQASRIPTWLILTYVADTNNGYFANGETLSFDSKAPAKGDVFASIGEMMCKMFINNRKS